MCNPAVADADPNAVPGNQSTDRTNTSGSSTTSIQSSQNSQGNDDDDDDGGAPLQVDMNNPAPAPAPQGGKSRRKQALEAHLVTGHQVDDSQLPAIAANNDSPDSNGWDIAADVADTIGDLSNATSEVVDNFDVGIKSDNDRENTASGASLGVSAAGLASSVFGLFSNSKKYKAYKNKDKKEAAKRRLWANSVDVVGNAISGASALSDFGYFLGAEKATKEGSKAQRDAGIMDITSGVLGVTSGLLNYFANRSERDANKNVAAGANALADDNAVSNLAPGSSQQDVTTAMAKQYAMRQAQKLHQDKYDKSSNRGIMELLKSGTSVGMALSGIGKMTSGTTSTVFNILGSVTNGIGIVAGLGERAYDNFFKKESRVKKDEIIDEYLDEEVNRILAEANSWQPSVNEQADLAQADADDGANTDTTLSNAEARRLAMLRLGVRVDSNAEVDSQEKRDELFTLLTRRRANYIMNSNPNEKDQMITALGLDPQTATFTDVYNVLSGETY